MSLDTPPAALHFDRAPLVETDIPGPASRRLIDRQGRIESNAVSYPKQIPIALEAGRGATLRDVDGNVFIDMFAGIGVLNVGHSNPYVVSGVKDQVGSLVQTLDFPTTARIELMERLNEIAPSGLRDNNRIMFGGPTGSNAVEASLKLARYVTGNQGIIAFRGGYHGSTFGALAISANNARKRDYEPVVPGAVHVPYPTADGESEASSPTVETAIENVRELLGDPYSGLANPGGIWVEAIQGEGGVVVPPSGFLPRLAELARSHDVPLIVDEIQTGFGRTGEWFASEHEGITPDIMPLGKAIGGVGLPLSAMMIRSDLDIWDSGGHVGTFRGNVAGMVAGTRAIEYMQRHDLPTHASELGEYIRSRLREVATDTPELVDVRGRGLMIGAEFRDADGRPDPGLVKNIRSICYSRGVLVWNAGRHKHVLRLLPPLVLTEGLAERAMDIVTGAIDEATD